MRNSLLRFDDEFIKEYFEKRKLVNELEEELKEMSGKIKNLMLEHRIIYSSTKHYNIWIIQRHKISKKFIELLKKNHMENFITEICYKDDFEKANEILKVDPKDYKEIDCNVLKVRKK